MAALGQALKRAWSFIRELSDDDAYERYLAHHRAGHPHCAPLSRREFFIAAQQRKWNGIKRCC